MAYLVASVWTPLLPRAAGTITGTSLPLSIDKVASIAEQISNDLDAAAAAGGYAVPIGTGATVAYSQMALYTGWGLGWTVLRTIFPAEEVARMPLAAEYREAYETTKKALRDGKLVIVGAGSDTGEGARELPRSFQTSNSGDDVSAYASPTIELDTVF